ncbi:MAG: S9 family peptidase [Prevotella sp.]|nr:S9 family peptidase [Prevotella sp.]
MKKQILLTMAATLVAASSAAQRTMTPEDLWAMSRISQAQASPDGSRVAYQVGYYSVPQNNSQQKLLLINADGTGRQVLTTGQHSETDPQWLPDGRIAFLCNGQIWTMNADGSSRRQLSHTEKDIEGYAFSPDGTKVLLLHSLPFHDIIQKNPDDLPKATGRRITDLMYRHWDHYVETILHPFIYNVTPQGDIAPEGVDMLDGQPYECPVEPFGGMEQLCWSPDSKQIAYTARKKKGLDYAISTDTDIYLYDIASAHTRNLCKPQGYVEPKTDPTKTMKRQAINAAENLQYLPGYDQNPQFSPDGKYIAWTSMARAGYEADRNRLCLMNIATGEKRFMTEQFDSNVDAFCFARAKDICAYFIGVWHGTINMYQVDWNGNVQQLTDQWADWVSIAPMNDGRRLLCMRQSLSAPTDIYVVEPTTKKIKGKKTAPKATVTQLTHENDALLSQLSFGRMQQRWVKTTDGQQMLVWIMLPANYVEGKKYPTLLFCEGGPQSPVSQFWSYRWNFQIMAANGYVVVAPNRRGLPGFGQQWLEQISGDWTGQCMLDYLTAIDDAADNLPFVDRDRLAAVGASFGGFSVYYLAGHHKKRFKCFIAHDGAFNLESMYTDTEEVWFSNWEYDDAYWNRDLTPQASGTYANSPHRFVEQWDTPILCIHGEKDYRICYNQGMGAFNAARLRGIPAELLLFPDENHWVLKPQNGILWQRTFFGWLDKWLK